MVTLLQLLLLLAIGSGYINIVAAAAVPPKLCGLAKKLPFVFYRYTTTSRLFKFGGYHARIQPVNNNLGSSSILLAATCVIIVIRGVNLCRMSYKASQLALW